MNKKELSEGRELKARVGRAFGRKVAIAVAEAEETLQSAIIQGLELWMAKAGEPKDSQNIITCPHCGETVDTITQSTGIPPQVVSVPTGKLVLNQEEAVLVQSLISDHRQASPATRTLLEEAVRVISSLIAAEAESRRAHAGQEGYSGGENSQSAGEADVDPLAR